VLDPLFRSDLAVVPRRLTRCLAARTGGDRRHPMRDETNLVTRSCGDAAVQK